MKKASECSEKELSQEDLYVIKSLVGESETSGVMHIPDQKTKDKVLPQFFSYEVLKYYRCYHYITTYLNIIINSNQISVIPVRFIHL